MKVLYALAVLFCLFLYLLKREVKQGAMQYVRTVGLGGEYKSKKQGV